MYIMLLGSLAVGIIGPAGITGTGIRIPKNGSPAQGG
jgi:hypothetical protein